MRSSLSLSFLVMMGVCAGSAAAPPCAAQSASPGNPPPFPGGPPPAPDMEEVRLLNVRSNVRSGNPALMPPAIVSPALPGQTGARALGPTGDAPQQIAEKDGVLLRVTSRYTRTFAKFHMVATVEATDRGTIDKVTWTGPGRFGTTSVDAADKFKVELDSAEPFTIRARPFRPGLTGEKAKRSELSVQVDAPNAAGGPLPEALKPVAVATAMRTGGWQYELKLDGDPGKLEHKVLEAEWLLPEGFQGRDRVSTDASTGYAVTGNFDSEFPASVRVLFDDGTVGLGFVTVSPK